MWYNPITVKERGYKMIFIVIAVVIIILFFAGMGYGIGNSDGEHRISGIVVAIIIVAAIILIFWASFTQERTKNEHYNNGICTICGGEYEFSGATRTNTSQYYYYTCEDCGHTIEVNRIMK